jgi:hypothetical protein
MQQCDGKNTAHLNICATAEIILEQDAYDAVLPPRCAKLMKEKEHKHIRKKLDALQVSKNQCDRSLLPLRSLIHAAHAASVHLHLQME